jgi:UDP-N-acetylmuramoyl-L-alanyl-D-glutamate--2,6-diaminopimelate ligase
MPLSTADIIQALDAGGLLVETRGDIPHEVRSVSDDTRSLERGDLFIAVRGLDADGHHFLDMAAERGAAVVIVEDVSRTALPAIVVRESRRAAAIAAAVAFGNPANALVLVGVTGTNGKSTSVAICRHLLQPLGPTASIGTLGVVLGAEGEQFPGGGGLTTPGPVELQRVLRNLVDRGVRVVAMEVSSHSLDQRRVEGLEFAAALFTNLTRDHLDYHETMEAYFEAKARLIAHLKPDGAAVVNSDDPAWDKLPGASRLITFGVKHRATIHATDVRFTPLGSEWTLHVDDQSFAVSLPLLGDVNVHNALGAAGVAYALGVAPTEIAQLINNVPQVAGRLEVIGTSPTVLRDYAHSPDALDRAISAVRPFTRGELILVFGCGGDRDRGKRPIMGGIAAEKADRVIVTSDNPRTENPERIIDDIVAGMPDGSYERMEDRTLAIDRALEIAGPNDVILLAGKGHETYQIRGTTKYDFDEKQIVAELQAARVQR